MAGVNLGIAFTYKLELSPDKYRIVVAALQGRLATDEQKKQAQEILSEMDSQRTKRKHEIVSSLN